VRAIRDLEPALDEEVRQHASGLVISIALGLTICRHSCSGHTVIE
jgi:hypothetical protein